MTARSDTPAATPAEPVDTGAPRLVGCCHALYAFDVARGIDLRRAQESLTTSRRTVFHHKSRVPDGTGMSVPLRFSWPVRPRSVGSHTTTGEAEVALYELGALCVTWSLPVDAPLEDLVRLSALLYDHGELTAASREVADEVVRALAGAVDRPGIAQRLEDYIVFQVEPWAGGPPALLAGTRPSLARLLRAEEAALSTQEVDEALAHPVSYGRDDVCLVDWLAALLVGPDTDDERLVLELATVELLELRLLDAQLQERIEEAYELVTRPRGFLAALAVQRRELDHVARIQADNALLHEGIDNALKLFGDDYLARLHATAARRFHFADWGLSIQRKLAVLRTVHQSLSDLAAHRRSEALEWIIILLIAVDIVLYLTPFR